ncbi:MAG TPA: hypothetical protein VIF09_07505 [Polyangiaceae bacterium]
MTAKLQSIADLRTATELAQATAKAKVADEKVKLPSLLVFMAAYVAFVKATFGNVPDSLAAFGLATKKARTPLTAEQVAAKVAKMDATRKARGTMGPKQKKAVKGGVTGVVVTPVTTPPHPSPQPAGGNGPATHGA